MSFKALSIVYLLLLGAADSALAQTPADSLPLAAEKPAPVLPPRIQWEKRQIDVGKVPYGLPVTRDFVVQNHSDSLLQITKVRTGCHCTVATWTEEPIPPGEKGIVHVTFDAQKEEEFYKVIIVFTNQDVEQPVGLIFKGFVNKKPAEKGQ